MNELKILHMCLAAFYIDNYTYQENMLPKYHRNLGFEVEILASLVTFDKNGKPSLFKKGSKYINEYGISVTRLEYKKSVMSKTLRKYVNTYEEISRAKPDIIFIHGLQFLDIKHVKRYCEEHPDVKLYIDNHADFSNSARSWLSKNILHRLIWKTCAKTISSHTKKFYGVLPSRVDFLRNVYKVPIEKVELLLMGAEDDKVEEAKRDTMKKKIREEKHITSSDFLVVTGGKIDHAKKQTLLLMKAIKQINNPRLKLLVFGSVVEELQHEFNALVDGDRIQYIGWLDAEESYNFFGAADLVVFPGRHSVYWEQVAGLGIPMIVKYWDGTDHIDVGGNCDFLYDDSVNEIQKKLTYLLENPEKYTNMKEIGENTGKKKFSYSEIAKQSIEFKSL